MLSLESPRVFQNLRLFYLVHNKSLNDAGPLKNSEFCFPRISMFPSTSSRDSRETKFTVPQGTSH